MKTFIPLVSIIILLGISMYFYSYLPDRMVDRVSFENGNSLIKLHLPCLNLNFIKIIRTNFEFFSLCSFPSKFLVWLVYGIVCNSLCNIFPTKDRFCEWTKINTLLIKYENASVQFWTITKKKKKSDSITQTTGRIFMPITLLWMVYSTIFALLFLNSIILL